MENISHSEHNSKIKDNLGKVEMLGLKIKIEKRTEFVTESYNTYPLCSNTRFNPRVHKNIFKNFYFMCISILPAHKTVHCMNALSMESRGNWIPCNSRRFLVAMCARNHTQVLYKNNKCSQTLSHLSNSLPGFHNKEFVIVKEFRRNHRWTRDILVTFPCISKMCSHSHVYRRLSHKQCKRHAIETLLKHWKFPHLLSSWPDVNTDAYCFGCKPTYNPEVELSKCAKCAVIFLVFEIFFF